MSLSDMYFTPPKFRVTFSNGTTKEEYTHWENAQFPTQIGHSIFFRCARNILPPPEYTPEYLEIRVERVKP